MHTLSLNLKTDLAILSHFSTIEERKTYWVIKSHTNPGYHWGNFLIFKDPPTFGSYQKWLNAFDIEFRSESPHHRAFAWIGQTGSEDVSEWTERGFEKETHVCLAGSALKLLPQANKKITVFRIAENENDHWDNVLASQLIVAGDLKNDLEFVQFKKQQLLDYRNIVKSGFGDWFFAVDEKDNWVADLGLFYSDGIARYQYVSTRPDFQGQGICHRLLYESALYAAETHSIKQVVIVAEADSKARVIYENVGLKSHGSFANLYHPNFTTPHRR